MKKGDCASITVGDMNNLGCGVGRLPDGRVVFVRGGVTGDVLTVSVIKVAKDYCVARIVGIEKPSENRTDEVFCDAPQSCGGCVYRNITYSHELEIKRNSVKSAFRRAGVEVEVGEIRSTGATSGYRNKAQYPVRQNGNRLQAGFFATGTHKVMSSCNCSLQPPVFGEIASFVCEFASQRGVTAYDETTGRGVLRHIYIRYAKGTGEIMVCPVLKCESKAFGGEFAAEIVARFPDIVSVMLNYNRKNTNVVTGDEYVCLYGKTSVEDILCSLRFTVTPASFYQVNHDAAELLYGIAGELCALTGKEKLADIYCGTGTIGLTLVGRASRLTGIEIVRSAVECAEKNAELNGIKNAEFICGDATTGEGVFASVKNGNTEYIPDTAIIDPPRKGTTPELIRYLSEKKVKRVVYVSCNPETLARDCKIFMSNGYKVEGKAVPVDMFPRTGHVETVVALVLNDE